MRVNPRPGWDFKTCGKDARLFILVYTSFFNIIFKLAWFCPWFGPRVGPGAGIWLQAFKMASILNVYGFRGIIPKKTPSTAGGRFWGLLRRPFESGLFKYNTEIPPGQGKNFAAISPAINRPADMIAPMIKFIIFFALSSLISF